jgi:hypothetical protein
MIRRFLEWVKLVFTPTHRVMRLAPGMYLQIPRGMTDRQINAALRTALTKREMRKWLLS